MEESLGNGKTKKERKNQNGKVDSNEEFATALLASLRQKSRMICKTIMAGSRKDIWPKDEPFVRRWLYTVIHPSRYTSGFFYLFLKLFGEA
jgi:hypothetical protein